MAAELNARLAAASPSINNDLAQFLAGEIWNLTQFLTGSTTKQIPYEVAYAIERAAKEWTGSQLLVTTAIIQESNFYFLGSNERFFQAVEAELGIAIASRPVQIALPYIYRHRPLFCIPLFHELGHFVDNINEVINTSMLISPQTVGPDLPDLPTSAEIAAMPAEQQAYIEGIVLSHRREYFADIFSAAYVGAANMGFMREFCPNNNASASHPSSSARFALMQSFINRQSDPIIDLFQNSLSKRGLPTLGPRFESAPLSNSFGNVRPFSPASDAQVFGLFEAGWDFLMTQWEHPVETWSVLSDDDRVRIANDLTEKSIRNRMVIEGWHASTHAN